MYHTIHPTTENNRGNLEITTDIGSFEGVVSYLVNRNYYFPTPLEFSEDIKSGTCRHKYAIITIDDSWNDPEKMGVTEVLKRYRMIPDARGGPKVWFAVITRQMMYFENGEPVTMDPWERLSSFIENDLVYIISHSQTHPLPPQNSDPASKDNISTYKTVSEEMLKSRKDIMWYTETDPYFFVYPGGVIAYPMLDSISSAGYVGAFTVWPGSLDQSMPYYLPRINGGLRCGTTGIDNSFCVIQEIEKYSK